MSIVTTSRNSFLSVLFVIFCGFSANAQSVTTTTGSTAGYYSCGGGLSFGTPPGDGTPCIGRGICDNTGGINVTCYASSQYANQLIMTFSLSQLQQVQPDQVEYFTSGSYMFNADYCLSSNPFFAPLNLPANSWILTTSNSTVQINGDVVTVYIMYSVINN